LLELLGDVLKARGTKPEELKQRGEHLGADRTDAAGTPDLYLSA
jgi:hypothetical protein